MTETEPPPSVEPGVNRENLRDYTRLHRSVADRKIAGVAGGLGRHLNVDPTVLRVAFVVFAFFGGAGLLLYGALWLLVPEDGKDEAPIATSSGTRNAVLVAVAVVAALLLLGDSWGGFGFPWPLAVIALVVAIVLVTRDRGGNPAAYPDQAHSTEERTVPFAPAYQAPPPGGYAPPPPAQPPVRPYRGPLLFWPTLALMAVALGALGLFDVAGAGIPGTTYPSVALAVVGLMLVVGAWYGRPGGLILLGLVAAVVRLGMTVADQPLDEAETRVEQPTTAAAVLDHYSMPAGSLHLDLSDIRDVEPLDGRVVQVESNVGQVLVTVPRGVDVTVDADLGLVGGIDVLGESHGGPGASLHRTIDGGVDVPEMTLQLDLEVGSIEVRQ